MPRRDRHYPVRLGRHPDPGPAELLNSVGGSRRGTWSATGKNKRAVGALHCSLHSVTKKRPGGAFFYSMLVVIMSPYSPASSPPT